MSTLQVEVCEVEEVLPHPNADKLELLQIKGWQSVAPIGKHKVGDLIVYFPPDTVLPQSVSDELGVTQYLSNGRIRCAKLRGEPSFGLVATPADPSWRLGDDVAAHYGATKYEPPVPSYDKHEPIAEDNSYFAKYTEIENMRNFSGIFEEREPVIVTEKVCGKNGRIGIVNGELFAGSRKHIRISPSDDAKMLIHSSWFPYTLPQVKILLETISRSHDQVILYGEVFGKIQKGFDYGLPGQLGYRAFDIMIDGKYLDYSDFVETCLQFGIPMVPLVKETTFDMVTIKALSEGQTNLNGNHIREGVVVKPAKERYHPKVGRVILKYVSDTYLLDQKGDVRDV